MTAWFDVLEAVRAVLAADATLTGIVPAADITLAGQKAFSVPMIEMTVVSDTEQETWAPVLIQFDLWTRNAADLKTAETRIRTLVSDSVPMTLDGVEMWALYQAGRVLPGPEDGVFSRSFDIEYQMIRSPTDRFRR